MQISLSKTRKNITIFVFTVLSIIALSNTASAQWVINTGDSQVPGSSSSSNNHGTIYVIPGKPYHDVIIPNGTLSNISFSISSSVPNFAYSKITGALTPNNPFNFIITVPTNVPLNQINYQIVLNGILTTNNGPVFSSFTLYVKPRIYASDVPQKFKVDSGDN